MNTLRVACLQMVARGPREARYCACSTNLWFNDAVSELTVQEVDIIPTDAHD